MAHAAIVLIGDDLQLTRSVPLVTPEEEALLRRGSHRATTGYDRQPNEQRHWWRRPFPSNYHPSQNKSLCSRNQAAIETIRNCATRLDGTTWSSRNETRPTRMGKFSSDQTTMMWMKSRCSFVYVRPPFYKTHTPDNYLWMMIVTHLLGSRLRDLTHTVECVTEWTEWTFMLWMGVKPRVGFTHFRS